MNLTMASKKVSDFQGLNQNTRSQLWVRSWDKMQPSATFFDSAWSAPVDKKTLTFSQKFQSSDAKSDMPIPLPHTELN